MRVALQGRNKPQINTLIFDVSGVLLNDLYAVWKADSEAYKYCGVVKINSLESFKESFKIPILDYHRSMCVPENIIPELEIKYR